jgi:protein phosphatase
MRLTEDHSIVEGLIRAGQLSSDDSRVHPLRHVVTRSLGQTDDATPTIRTAEWATGDRLLLCSDGLSNMLSDIEIQTMLQEENVSCHDLCDRLVDLANDRGGLDNITIVLGQHL